MTLDRDQIKRDAEWVLTHPGRSPRILDLARHCLALLTELEQADRDLKEATDRMIDLVAECEARLAKVPPLAEALRELANSTDYSLARIHAREALAAWEADT